MAKIFKFRGKTLEELQTMSIKELSELFTASVRRKMKRGFTEAEKKVIEKIRKGKNRLKTHCRELIILPEMVGKTILVHKGNAFEAVIIMEEMIGHRLGEFVQNRKKLQHSAPGVGATKSTGHVSVK